MSGDSSLFSPPQCAKPWLVSLCTSGNTHCIARTLLPSLPGHAQVGRVWQWDSEPILRHQRTLSKLALLVRSNILPVLTCLWQRQGVCHHDSGDGGGSAHAVDYPQIYERYREQEQTAETGPVGPLSYYHGNNTVLAHL